MHTLNEIEMDCPLDEAFGYARRVDLWPERLAHYRKVRFLHGDQQRGGIVEMAASRRFERFGWPVWWVSTMEIDERFSCIRYRHIRGITRGMDVEWRLVPVEGGRTKAIIVHEWKEPHVGRLMAEKLIGPVFVHFIADETLYGLKAAAGRRREAAANE